MENNTLKKIMYALIAVAVLLAGALAYIWYQKTSLVKELTIDKEELTDNSQPVTVTLLVNQRQAELLAEYEKTSSMHFTLEYRGDAATAQRYLDIQNQYFAEHSGEAKTDGGEV